jgi:hypothetical protein
MVDQNDQKYPVAAAAQCLKAVMERYLWLCRANSRALTVALGQIKLTGRLGFGLPFATTLWATLPKINRVKNT